MALNNTFNQVSPNQHYNWFDEFTERFNNNPTTQTGNYANSLGSAPDWTYYNTAGTAPTNNTTDYVGNVVNNQGYNAPQDQFRNLWSNAGTFSPMPTNNKPGDNVQMMPTKTMQGNENVLLGAQNRVMSGMPNTTLDMTSQATQNLLNDPNMGYNPQQYMQGALEGFDYNRANALEAARQGMADTMNTGQTRGDLVQLALQGARDRSGFQNQLEQEETARKRQALLDSIAEGRTTAEQERSGYATDIESLVKVRDAGEGEENRVWQSGENVKDRGLEYDINERNLKGDIYIANQAARLEAMGIGSNEAIQFAKIDQDSWKNVYNANLARYQQDRMNYHDAMMLADEQAFLAGQGDLDRQVSMLVAAGKLTAESYENAVDRAFNANMAYLENEFALKGISLAAVINNMQDMDPDVAKSFLTNLAEENGITIPNLSEDEKEDATTRVNQDAAEEVLSGVSEPPRSQDDPSYDGLLKLESTPKVGTEAGWGPKTTHNPRGAGNDWKGYVNFDNAIDNNNGYISVDGKLYKVSRERINRAGVDGMKYTFVDVVTGNKFNKKT